jgi:hypothetical protein
MIHNMGLTNYVAVIIWLIYLICPERILESTGDGLRKTDLESWNQELQRMVQL